MKLVPPSPPEASKNFSNVLSQTAIGPEHLLRAIDILQREIDYQKSDIYRASTKRWRRKR